MDRILQIRQIVPSPDLRLGGQGQDLAVVFHKAILGIEIIIAIEVKQNLTCAVRVLITKSIILSDRQFSKNKSIMLGVSYPICLNEQKVTQTRRKCIKNEKVQARTGDWPELLSSEKADGYLPHDLTLNFRMH